MSKFDVRALMDRIKTMEYYKVVIHMDHPIEFRGRVPYDIKINKDNIAQFTILASSYDEAERKAWDFIHGDDSADFDT